MKGDEFIREVDEAVRQDRWMALWNAYGTYVVGAALAVVLGTTAGVGWREWQERSRLAQAERYVQAVRLLEEDRPAEAADAFAAIAEDSSDGYAVLARLRLAEARAAAGDEEAGLATLEALSRDDDAGRLYRQLSELMILQKELPELGPARTLERLEPLTRDDSPWRYSALELKALAELESGEASTARATLNELVRDPAVPAGIGRRAAEMLQALGGPIEEDPASRGAGSS